MSEAIKVDTIPYDTALCVLAHDDDSVDNIILYRSNGKYQLVIRVHPDRKIASCKVTAVEIPIDLVDDLMGDREWCER